ncbi:MAG: glutamine-hydrolyzing GMP synthase, partial [Fusobacteriaceae bacterium]
MKKNGIIILDFGSQYNQLIARRVREMGVYAEVVPYFEPLDKILEREPKGIIMSGGPASTYLEGSPSVDSAIYEAGIPILGICYGMQLTSRLLGGEVERADMQEFGKAELLIDDAESILFKDIPNNNIVWMSHGDHVTSIPEGFKQIAHTDSCIAAIENREK